MKNLVAEYFKECRVEKRFSLRKVSKLSGISYTYIKSIEDGRFHPTFEKVMKMLSVYEKNPEDFLRMTGYLPTSAKYIEKKEVKKVPILKSEDLRNWDRHSDITLISGSGEFVEISGEGGNLLALEVENDEMSPEFLKGEILIVNPTEKVRNGDYVVYKSDSDVVLRQLKVYNGTTILRALNPALPEVKITKEQRKKILGKVIEKRKKY